MIVEIPAKLHDGSDATLVFRHDERHPDGWYLRDGAVEYQVRPNQLGLYLDNFDSQDSRDKLVNIPRALASGSGWETFRPPRLRDDGRYVPADIDESESPEPKISLEGLSQDIRVALQLFQPGSNE